MLMSANEGVVHSGAKSRKCVPHSTKKLLYILQKMEQNPEMKLYTFISYDKYDSLVYFPHSLARCCTSANAQAYSRLITRHLHSCCETSFADRVVVCKTNRNPITLTTTKLFRMALPGWLNMFEISRDAHPDSVFNVLSTSVDTNRIHTVTMYTYTDVPEMYVTSMNESHPFMRVPQAGRRRSVLLAKYLQLYLYPEHIQQQFTAMFDSTKKLVFHLKVSAVYTFRTFGSCHKITDATHLTEQTSVEYEGTMYNLR